MRWRSRSLGTQPSAVPDRRRPRIAAALDRWAPLLSVVTAQIRDVVEHTERASMEMMGEAGAADEAAVRLTGLTEELLRSAAQTAEQVTAAVDGTIGVLDELAALVTARDRAVHDLIGEIRSLSPLVDAITGIAQETTVLALNAKIEAARAGDSASGFTVVAEEVSHLADASAGAAGNISTGITRVTALAERRLESESGARGGGDAAEIENRLRDIMSTQRQMAESLVTSTTTTLDTASQVEQAAGALGTRTTAVLAAAQFQDIIRQSLESVTAALGQLGEQAGRIATVLRTCDVVDDPAEFEDAIGDLQASYVSRRQRLIHAGTVGGSPSVSAEEPAVELF
jgi:methyl-accepting chemotaxis protein